MDFRLACGRAYHRGRAAAEIDIEAAEAEGQEDAAFERYSCGSVSPLTRAYLDGVAHVRLLIPPVVDRDGNRIEEGGNP